MGHSSVIVTKSIVLQVPRNALWEFLSDTDRLNKAVGLPAITFTPNPDPSKTGYFVGRIRFMGLTFTYDELPYDWVEGQYYKVVRKFTLPILKEIGINFALHDVPQGTEFEITIELAPKSIITILLTKFIFARLAFNDVFKTVRAFEREYKTPSDNSLQSYEKMYETNIEELGKRFQELEHFNCDTRITELLRTYILKGSDIDLVRIRPFELAGKWNVDRYKALTTFIFATKSGILDLHWTVLCPNCRGVSSDALTLSELKSEAHCDTCKIDYGADFSSSIEARFTLHPSIRVTRHDTYCIGGPANMPQIVSQFRVQPSHAHSEILELAIGTLRLRTFQTEEIHTIRVTESSSHSNITAVTEEGRLRFSPNEVQSGKIKIDVNNRLSREVLVILERESWKDNAATAAIVTSLQEFRDIFPSEAVAPGAELGIASIAILFTDLKGSTALYNTIGDTKAFEFVQNHFRFLTESVARQHGGILKTMGDAIMATFATGKDAFISAIEMQTKWSEFLREYGKYDEIALKIGIHEGSAIVINNKGKLDYFGTTVNVAGRLQKYAQGHDIILTEELVSSEELNELLPKGIECSIESFPAELKGLEREKFILKRVRVG